MTFPQVQPDQLAVNGSQFFRINTLLSSPGDMYESTQGGLAFVLGPDSDVDRVNVAYFDPNVAGTLLNKFTVDSRRPFVGRISAQLDQTYQPSGRPGKILIWPDDLFNPSYVPGATTGFTAGDNLITIAPRLDVIQYFDNPPTLESCRADKEYNLQTYVSSPVKPTWIVIPTYGRRYGSVAITNNGHSGAGFTFQVIGVRYAYESGAGTQETQETIIQTDTIAPGAQVVTNNFLGAGGGMYDAIVVNSGDSGPVPMRVYLSDR